jgi:phospholipid/cholesterol/gamma-HCH transport system ATP-binding protein
MVENYIVILEKVPLTRTFEINLKIRKGQQVLIKGSKNLGKTTILKIIVGMVEPLVGNVMLFDKNIKQLPQYELLRLRKKLTYLGYPRGLIENWTVYQNITLPLKYHWQMKDQECENRIKELEIYLGTIHDLLPYQVSQVSNEKQKEIIVFRGMAMYPELVLIDLDEMQFTQPEFIYNLIQYIIDNKLTAIVTASNDQNLEYMEKFEILNLDKAGGRA